MSTITGIAGTLLPWLAGVACLYPLRARLGLNIPAVLGYGFFAGAAALYALTLLWQALLPDAVVVGTATTLIALTLAGAAWSYFSILVTTKSTGKTPALWLTVLLLALIGSHWLFVGTELYYRPVFPWDAWQTWMYTAKAWYFAGGPQTLVEPQAWLAPDAPLQNAALYNAPGAEYPDLVPTYAWWTAVCFGEWLENRVTLPTFFCGIALLLGIGGQVKANTGSLLAGVLAAYLLLSLPLFATHLSLAGYADIWMAGFGGLGMLAVLRGMLEHNRAQLLVGFGLLSAGFLAKHDAILWLALGLGIVGFVRQTRLAVIAVAVAVVIAGWMVQSGPLELPWLGTIGFADSRLYLGPLGSYALQLNNVAGAFARHLLLYDSWHTLWYVVAGFGVLVLVAEPLKPLRGVWLTFLALLTASQAVVFGGTLAGQWATDGTALNRLLLQQAPTLVFLITVSGYQLCAQPGIVPLHQRGQQRPWPVAAAGLVAFLLVGAVVVGFLSTKTVDGSSNTRRYDAQSLRAVAGAATLDGDGLRITRYDNAAAIITTGRTLLNAASFGSLELAITGRNHRDRTLFWRTAAAPDALFSQQINAGASRVDLDTVPDWKGNVTELGLVFYEDPGKPVSVQAMNLHPASLAARWQLLESQWFDTRPWDMASVNASKGYAAQTQLPLVLAIGVWQVLSALLTVAMRRGRRLHWRALSVMLLAGWIVLDGRWLLHSAKRADDTRQHYRQHSQHDSQHDSHANLADALDVSNDAELLTFTSDVRAALGDQPRRVLILAEDPGLRFEQLRIRYALLPHSGLAVQGSSADSQLQGVDAAIVVRSPDAGPRGNSALQHALQQAGMRPVKSSRPATLWMR